MLFSQPQPVLTPVHSGYVLPYQLHWVGTGAGGGVVLPMRPQGEGSAVQSVLPMQEALFSQPQPLLVVVQTG